VKLDVRDRSLEASASRPSTTDCISRTRAPDVATLIDVSKCGANCTSFVKKSMRSGGWSVKEFRSNAGLIGALTVSGAAREGCIPGAGTPSDNLRLQACSPQSPDRARQGLLRNLGASYSRLQAVLREEPAS
jgi:hypothetical protein